jgi:hypothetical protein
LTVAPKNSCKLNDLGGHIRQNTRNVPLLNPEWVAA